MTGRELLPFATVALMLVLPRPTAHPLVIAAYFALVAWHVVKCLRRGADVETVISGVLLAGAVVQAVAAYHR